MKHVKTVRAASGHTIAIFRVLKSEHPAGSAYSHFYVAKNFDEEGVTFFYLAKGYKDAPNQIMVWYKNKRMWTGFGNNLEEAINGAQRDGWLHAD